MTDIRIDDELRERSARLPFWRRPRRLRRQIAGTLVATALVAVALFGALNYVAADQLLRAGSFEQLDGVAAGRARSIELGAGRLLRNTGAVANDPGVLAALDDFVAAVAELDEEDLTDAQAAELDRFYDEELVTPLNESGLSERVFTVADVRPASPAARVLQYHLLVPGTPPLPADTAYAAALAEHGAFLEALSTTVGAQDLLLVSTDDRIVYATRPRVDLGAVLTAGAYAESALTRLVDEDLERVRAGTAVLTDFEIYIPNGARPTMFSAATIRGSAAQLSGAIVVEIPGERLDALTTADGDWEALGLGDGESYVVASDLLLQSASRAWLEDPEGYLDAVDDEVTRERIAVLGSPVGVQIVDTEPVRSAFRGEPFRGRSTNYLGRSVYSASATIDVPGVEWVVVTDVPLASARKPLNDYLWRLGIVVLIVVPLAAVVGILLARRLSRPIGPAVNAAQAVAEGDRDPQLPSLGNDEYGDLGRRLKRMAALLAAQEQQLEDEFQRKRDLMLSVLPEHLVDPDGTVAGSGERVDDGTVVSVVIRTGDDAEVDDRLAEHLVAAAQLAERLADERGLERVRTAADRYLFISGAGRPGDGVDEAVEFSRRFVADCRRLAVEVGYDVAVQVGLSTGPVATGVLQRGSLTFGAWGEPVRRALAISALSRGDEILLDDSTARRLEPGDDLVPVDGVVDLDEQPMELYSLAGDAVVTETSAGGGSAGGGSADGDSSD